ncbi:type VI secretion system protein ImpL [Burkholderia sp. YR290]|jgi:type VI secretion system protein ImpL|uniref:type VI secretion system membrane subunit TssM n=1 Tax=Paraburkholderia hospita TaxID=169430 RepID=UPI0009A62205|nr:type VI secretion system membrane subunit TssM [Paraburkholderia hospita]SKD01026.1 type VI secretion system protein ImpL [Paraburkholderia hospita]SOE84112.1 type VI secretion system protein ImpL [Burkholderia sp. YR290]
MKLLGWFMRPIVLSFLGVLALALIVWIEGPLLAFAGKAPLESAASRWIVIAVLFALWVLYWGVRWLLVRLANVKFTRVVAEEAPQPGRKESEADVAALKQRFDEAMTILRKARVKGRFGSQYVYQLPWYMFVGAPGTGKTTALLHSGLKFPLAERLGKQAVGGVGGTRNCDWWFTDDAVLLDTAGRFTTQDSFAEADQAAWGGFLQLLRKYRPRRPLNGVIVALSVQDLLQLSDTQRAVQAGAVRERLKELYTRLGMRFPVYVVVTKCDLLAGFAEFFDDLGRDEREQVWGVTFPYVAQGGPDEALASFPGEFAALEKQLQARVLHRMQQETDTRRRALVYGFPQQFAGLENMLTGFLQETFSTSRFDEAALLRGVYFTSGTQEGRPIDRVMSAVAAALGLQRQVVLPDPASGRAYFITRLMRDVIFQEAGLAGTNPKLERRRTWLQRIALGLIGIAVVLALVLFFVSYQRNRAYIANVEQHVTELQKLAQNTRAGDDPLVLLPLLNAARDLPGGYADRNKSVPWLSRLGLYQGDKLGLEAQASYRRLLKQTLLPLVVHRMEDELRRGDANNPDFQYEVLRAYLMLGDSAHFDADSVRLWADIDWRRGPLSNASDDQRNDIDGHLAALFQPAQFDASLPLDKDLIAQARTTLAKMPLAQRMFNRVARDLEQAKLPPFSVAAAAGRNAALVLVRKSGAPLTRGVSGAYTRAGYQKFGQLRDEAVVDVAKDNWVLGREESVLTPNGIDDLKSAMTQLYYDEYIKQWDALLADVAVVPFDGVEKGARVANVLAAPDSPLKAFMLAASQETTLGTVKTGGSLVEQGVGALGNKLDAVKKRLENALGNQPDDAAPPPAQVNPVDAHFQALHELAGKPGAAGPVPLDTQLAALKDAASYLEASDAARKQGLPAPPGDALNKLKLVAQGAPAPLAGIANDIASGGSMLMVGGERARLNALWQANVAQLCRQALDGRYPLVRGSNRDAAPDDFGRILGPGGLIDDFFQKNLATLVDMSGPQWRWRTGADSLGIPVDVLAQFQRAAQIRDAFFRAGGRDVSVRFTLKVLDIDPAIDHATIDIDGQQLVAAHVDQSMVFQWPSGKGTGQAHVDFDPSGDSARADGPWALLHLMDNARLQPTAQADRFKMTFETDGHPLVLQLDASSVTNPFRRGVFEQFRCPDRL